MSPWCQLISSLGCRSGASKSLKCFPFVGHSPDADASSALTAAPRGRCAEQMIQLISIPHALRFTCALKPTASHRIRTTSYYNEPSYSSHECGISDSRLQVVLPSSSCSSNNYDVRAHLHVLYGVNDRVEIFADLNRFFSCFVLRS